MNEMILARNGYGKTIKSSGSERGTEYRVFASITQELSSLNEEAPDYHAKKASALHRNLQLWIILATDVANDNNKLPASLRSQLFYLAEFTRVHTAKIHAGEASPDTLIEINRNIMRGLRGPAEKERAL